MRKKNVGCRGSRVRTRTTRCEKFLSRLIAVSSLVWPAVGVFAQEADNAITDAIITGNQVEAAQRDAARRQQLPQVEDREAGEGPYILIEEPIFNTSLRVGLNWSDNPTTTADNRVSDASKSILVDLGVDTRIRNFEVGGHVYVGKNEYWDLDGLGSAYAAGFAYIGRAVSDKGDYLRMQLDHGSNYDFHFDNSSTYTSLRASWSRSINLAPVFNQFPLQVTPSLSATRFDYQNDALDYSAYSAALSFAQRISNRMSSTLSLAWTNREYDDFFESSTGVARDDDSISLSLNMNYSISEFLTLSLNTSWNDNQSALATSEYDAFTFGMNLGYRKTF